MNLGEYATNKKFTVSQLKNASGRYTHMYVWYMCIPALYAHPHIYQNARTSLKHMPLWPHQLDGWMHKA